MNLEDERHKDLRCYCARILLVAVMLSFAYTIEAADTYMNPVLPDIGPADPSVVYYDGLYYMYFTHDNKSYPVLTSPDLVDWTWSGEVFRPGPSNVWAPDVFHDPVDDRFYLYYTVDWNIGVAVSDHPGQPFTDLGTLVSGMIDAHMFRDDDGQYYLYYTNFNIYVQKMASPTEKADEPAVFLMSPTEPWEKMDASIVEGPVIIKHNGIYYMMYSGSGASGPHYAIGYATASSPMGPFTKYENNPIIAGDGNVISPGHNCVTTDDTGNLWMVYHQKQTTTVGWDRFICIDPLWFDEQGILHGRATRRSVEDAPVMVDPQCIPVDLQAASVTVGQVELQWTDDCPEESGFVIQRKPYHGVVDWHEVGATGPNTTTYTDTADLHGGVQYFYRVGAIVTP